MPPVNLESTYCQPIVRMPGSNQTVKEPGPPLVALKPSTARLERKQLESTYKRG